MLVGFPVTELLCSGDGQGASEALPESGVSAAGLKVPSAQDVLDNCAQTGNWNSVVCRGVWRRMLIWAAS